MSEFIWDGLLIGDECPNDDCDGTVETYTKAKVLHYLRCTSKPEEHFVHILDEEFEYLNKEFRKRNQSSA